MENKSNKKPIIVRKPSKFGNKLLKLGYTITDNKSKVSGAVKKKDAQYVIYMQWLPSKEDVYWKDVKWDRIYFAHEDDVEGYTSCLECGGMYTAIYVYTITGKNISKNYETTTIIHNPEALIDESDQSS